MTKRNQTDINPSHYLRKVSSIYPYSIQTMTKLNIHLFTSKFSTLDVSVTVGVHADSVVIHACTHPTDIHTG